LLKPTESKASVELGEMVDKPLTINMSAFKVAEYIRRQTEFTQQRSNNEIRNWYVDVLAGVNVISRGCWF